MSLPPSSFRIARAALALLAALPSVSCARSSAVVVPAGAPAAASPVTGADAGRIVAERHRVAALGARRFTHAQLWTALDPILGGSALRVTPIGRSVQGRELRAVTFGRGPTTVLLWSQMHGDESTATMSLADLLSWFSRGDADPVRARIADRLTVVMVPMLNPDGAELFQRENALGVDVNRDARRLATPEARALKALRDSIRPAFGFNLHDQGARILTGSGGRQVAIALLAPASNERRTYDGARVAARLVAAEIATVLQPEIGGRVAKYEDDFNPRAFGDLMQQWGTSTVLIESGALPGDPEKQRLRALNVLAITTALDAIATGRFRGADPKAYESLPFNSRSAVDVVVRGGHLVLPGAEPVPLDLALNYDEPVARTGPRVREVGDLAAVVAVDTVDATGLYLHPDPSMLTERDGARWLRINAPASLTLRRSLDATSEIVRAIGGTTGVRPR